MPKAKGRSSIFEVSNNEFNQLKCPPGGDGTSEKLIRCLTLDDTGEGVV